MKYRSVIIFTLFASIAQAEVWECKSKDGALRYLDSPDRTNFNVCTKFENKNGVFNGGQKKRLLTIPTNSSPNPKNSKNKKEVIQTSNGKKLAWKFSEEKDENGRFCHIKGYASLKQGEEALLRLYQSEILKDEMLVTQKGKKRVMFKFNGQPPCHNYRVEIAKNESDF